jgi:hypothetical protein
MEEILLLDRHEEDFIYTKEHVFLSSARTRRAFVILWFISQRELLVWKWITGSCAFTGQSPEQFHLAKQA